MVMQSVLTGTPQRVLHTTIAHVSKPSGSGAHTYTQYLVRVSDERSPGLNWTVYRRYSEFRNFKLALEEASKRGDMCAHCAIMSKRTCFVLFPHRRLFGNLREKTLEARRFGLNTFLDAVTKHARTCRESMTCQTRPLMDKFLMVNDMRYTYLNVDMSESSGADQSSKVSAGEKRVSMSGLSHRSLSMVNRTNRLSGYSDYREDAVRSCTEEWTHTESDELTEPATDPKADQPQEEASMTKNTTPQDNQLQQDESGVTVQRTSKPNLLAYANDRRSRTHSWNDNTSQPAARQSLASEWERSTYKQPSSTSTSRHSDPGLARNELLNFTRGSFSGGGRPHRAEGRPRSRKVHLSSAAKRVKKLEEAEARFSVQSQARKPKCLPRLATIPE
ncbi:PX domain-containing protein [Phytophthora infestans]|uniref:PX domain-containing protein n=1 Tax=Phytophthora infestans TaxID=4787 RepID=A0A833TFK5_PHYIN|nr:PX domain-containing protein [Phytophthora infestans]